MDEGEKIFTLRTTGKVSVCPFKMYKTDHRKLLIVPDTVGRFYSKRENVELGQLDFLTHVNDKLFFLYKKQWPNLESLHRHLSFQRCLVGRTQMLLIQLANLNPTEFAFAYTGTSGHTAVVAGEAIHLIACTPKEMSVRNTDRCFSELPESWGDQSYFMSSRTRIIQKKRHRNYLQYLHPFYVPFERFHRLGGMVHIDA